MAQNKDKDKDYRLSLNNIPITAATFMVENEIGKARESSNDDFLQNILFINSLAYIIACL